MTRQMRLDEVTAPEKFEIYNEDFDSDKTVICGVCGAAMQGGPVSTQMNRDNDFIGEWNFACRVCGEGAATLYITEDDYGVIDNIEGQGNKPIDVHSDEMEQRVVEVGDNEISAYFHKKFLNPAEWEEPD